MTRIVSRDAFVLDSPRKEIDCFDFRKLSQFPRQFQDIANLAAGVGVTPISILSPRINP